MAQVELVVPDIGGHENVDIIDVMVQVGDRVEAGDDLITLETDKATMDVPAAAAGVVKEVRVQSGDKISEGGVIAIIEAEGVEAQRTKPQEDKPNERVVTPAEVQQEAAAPEAAPDGHAGDR